jgi:hypothetical protein
MNYEGVWKGAVQSQKVPEATGETHKKYETGSHPEYNSKQSMSQIQCSHAR